MPRQRKSAPRILATPGDGQYFHGYQASVHWSEAEAGFGWQVLSYIIQPGLAPTVPLAEGLAPTYPEAMAALWLALAELDILREIGA